MVLTSHLLSNGYGDGRAISVFEAILNGKRWEFQLKGAGRTPYCRGADGRAVLRSSIREFLAQEHMHSLGIPTSRSLTIFTSQKEQVTRPWFRDNSYSKDPEVMIEEDVAITTRVAPSFLRVGQLELFGRRARKNEHPDALKELEMIVLHLIDREYNELINQDLDLKEKIILLVKEFQNRLTSMVADWIRVGYCQGNFNSDNCAAGGFTLDYGPFGFIEMFDPKYQSWTGGLAFVYDPEKTFVDKMNQELIEPVRVDTDDTERERLYLKRLLLDYLHETDSEITEYILQNFRAEIRNFWMVKPKNMTVLPLDPDKGD
jgi:hypothetical protein